ncbi:MAG: pseudaminic acid biosynthesis-associated methylase [Burkholderiales bacterium]
MGQFATEQEEFWAGEFGDSYVQRNQGDLLVAANVDLFSKALRVAQPIANCLEIGANIGLNVRALQLLFPGLEQHAIEINDEAVKQLNKLIPQENLTRGSILEFECSRTFDLVLIKGVLIHIQPDSLSIVYEKLFESTKRYLLVCEYYNPVPVDINYRGHQNRLFKRDFCGEILDRYPELTLVDYGFVYRRDPKFPQDDITWFLMEKHV